MTIAIDGGRGQGGGRDRSWPATVGGAAAMVTQGEHRRGKGGGLQGRMQALAMIF